MSAHRGILLQKSFWGGERNFSEILVPSRYIDELSDLSDLCFSQLARSGHSIASSVLRTGLFGQPRFPKTLNQQLCV